MLSIIIADDEVGIIDLCKMLIDYPNAEVIGEAHNSLELFDKIGELRPNTVITDICMPGMTGLELIEKAKKIYPDVNFIVMSGFTEFEYAQQALRLGVLEYLLKPIQKKDLNRILEKLDMQIEENQQLENQHKGLRNELYESQHALREKYILDIWHNNMISSMPSISKTPVLDFGENKIQVVLLCVDSRFVAHKSESIMLIQQAQGLFDTIKDSTNQDPNWSFFIQDGFNGIYLIVYPQETAQQQSCHLLKQISSELRTFNNQNGFAKISASSSLIVDGDEKNIPELFRQVKVALKWRLEKQESQVIGYQEDLEFELKNVSIIERSKDLKDAILAKNEDLLATIVNSIWKITLAENKIVGIRYRTIEELVTTLNYVLSELPGSSEISESMKLDLFEIMSGCSSTNEIPNRIIVNTLVILEYYKNYFDNRESNVILQAKQYILQNFDKDLSLNAVSKYVCLSPAYFSTLFKNETGCGFAKYLQQVRVEEAKKLLKTTKLRIGDIALAVGYRDIKSFNKIFFNETQVKPSEYRKFYT